MYRHLLDSVALREVALKVDRLTLLSTFEPKGDSVQVHWKQFKKELAQVVVKSAEALGIPAGRLIFNLVVCFITNQPPPKLVISPQIGPDFIFRGKATTIVRWCTPQKLLIFCNQLFDQSRVNQVFFMEAVIIWAMNNQPKEEN